MGRGRRDLRGIGFEEPRRRDDDQAAEDHERRQRRRRRGAGAFAQAELDVRLLGVGPDREDVGDRHVAGRQHRHRQRGTRDGAPTSAERDRPRDPPRCHLQPRRLLQLWLDREQAEADDPDDPRQRGGRVDERRGEPADEDGTRPQGLRPSDIAEPAEPGRREQWHRHAGRQGEHGEPELPSGQVGPQEEKGQRDPRGQGHRLGRDDEPDRLARHPPRPDIRPALDLGDQAARRVLRAPDGIDNRRRRRPAQDGEEDGDQCRIEREPAPRSPRHPRRPADFIRAEVAA